MKLEVSAFFDLQVNGFAGVDFNDAAITIQSHEIACRALLTTGVTRFLPTIITGSREAMSRCLRAIAIAAEAPEIGPSIAGVHMEGPWISPEDGPRGAHPRAHVRPPDRDEFRALQDAAGGRIKLVTLAPEVEHAASITEWLVQQGIRVSIGHTGASASQIADVVSAGATLSTHLGNGCAEFVHRHNNPLWPQMADDRLTASFIVDGHHLYPSMVKSMIRAKTTPRTILVTDASSPAACQPGRYRLGESEVELTPEGRVHLAGTSRLAGSALCMHQAVGNVVRMGEVSIEDAIAMASTRPAQAMGLSFPNDRVLLDVHDGRVFIHKVFREGELLWQST